jgi:hypothetical protein
MATKKEMRQPFAAGFIAAAAAAVATADVSAQNPLI